MRTVPGRGMRLDGHAADIAAREIFVVVGRRDAIAQRDVFAGNSGHAFAGKNDADEIERVGRANPPPAL